MMMQAIRAVRFGGPEVLMWEAMPEPEPKADEVVVTVSVADTLFIETQIRAGLAGDYFKITPPYVPGFAVVGVVRSVGPNVDASWIGRRIAGHTELHGGYAERAVVRVDRLLAVPDALDDRTAAALLHDGPTALRLADAAKVARGSLVLVTAAGGGLGLLLVQLAHAAGAKVIGAARGKSKLAAAKRAGADEVVDYAEPDWAARVEELTHGKRFDVVFDGAGGVVGEAAFALTARGGHFSAHGAPSGSFASVSAADAEARGITLRGIEHVQMSAPDLKVFAERALAEAAAGHFLPVIGKVFPLAEAASAHAAIEARGVIGKTLLIG